MLQRVLLIPDGLQQIVVNPDIDKEQTHSVINSTLYSDQITTHFAFIIAKGTPLCRMMMTAFERTWAQKVGLLNKNKTVYLTFFCV